MSGRNHSLDVLRAVAILMVLTTHLANTFAHGTGFAKAVSVGGRGVDLFFVLSGWLLGSQLFRERRTTGTVNVWRFWLRRWLRTLPAYYAVVGFTFCQLAVTGKSQLIDPRYLVFVQNYFEKREILGVTWSLCVEEHFYLIIAPLVWLGGRYRWAVVLTLMVVGGLIAAHIAGLYPHRADYHISETHVVFEQCALGVVLAWLATHKPDTWQLLCRAAPLSAWFGLLLIVVAVLNRTVWDWWLPDWGTGGWAVIFGTWILLANSSPASAERGNWTTTAVIAARAYSLYLVHMDAIAVAKKLPLPPIGQVVASAVLMAVAAEVLYRLVERPCARLRAKLPS